MNYFKQAAAVLLILAFGTRISAGQEPFRVSDLQVRQLLTQLDSHAESFRKNLDKSIETGVLRNSEIGDYLKRFAREFEQLTGRLKERSHDQKPVSAEVQEVLNSGPYLDAFVGSYDFGFRAERDWQLIYADLNQLASYYKIETYWGVPTSLGHPPPVDLGALSNWLIGTYELDHSQSDDTRDAVEQAVNQLPPTERRRALTALVARMRAPERLAINRQKDQVTLVSSLQPARTYTATGQAYTGQGEIERVLLYGDKFRLSSVGEDDSRYFVTYSIFDEGAWLHVTHTAILNQFAHPLVIISYYKKVSDVPQLNLNAEDQNNGAFGRGSSQKRKHP